MPSLGVVGGGRVSLSYQLQVVECPVGVGLEGELRPHRPIRVAARVHAQHAARHTGSERQRRPTAHQLAVGPQHYNTWKMLTCARHQPAPPAPAIPTATIRPYLSHTYNGRLRPDLYAKILYQSIVNRNGLYIAVYQPALSVPPSLTGYSGYQLSVLLRLPLLEWLPTAAQPHTTAIISPRKGKDLRSGRTFGTLQPPLFCRLP